MNKIRYRFLAAVLCCLVFSVTSCGKSSGLSIQTSSDEEGETVLSEDETSPRENGDEEADEASQTSEDTTDGSRTNTAMIYVQVLGAVAQPGVYTLPEGSRLFEAIEMAGGLLSDADLSSVNQASVLTDGQMIYVYRVGEARLTQTEAQNGTTSAEDDRVNLNTATAEELMTLPGIGESKAASIILWREENGAFTSTEQLLDISGIKEGVYGKIKDRIKVN